jgi:F-type H+-transporting ATPase subunit b
MKIDFWTLGLQTLNILILLGVLRYFFWTPVAAMIAQRKALAQKTVTDRQALDKQVAAAEADAARIRAGFADERAALLKAAKAEAGRARESLLAQAKTEAAAVQTAAQTRLESTHEAARRAWSDRSNQLGVDIAGRLVARLDNDVVQAAFLDWLVQAIAALPAQARSTLADQVVALSVVSPAPLTEAAQVQATRRIGAAFGYQPQIAYSADPALIAGLELHAPHLAVSNSWRADLAGILESLANDQQH